MSHWRALLQRHVRQVRVYLGSAEQSQGAEKFLQNNFKELRMLNPEFPLQIRNAKGLSSDVPLPYIEARYHFETNADRRRARISVANMDEQEVEKVMEKMVLEFPANPKSTLNFERPELWTEAEKKDILTRIQGTPL